MYRNQDDEIFTKVYRKPTHTDHYLNFNSNHHPRIKTGVIKCLANRAKKICTKNNIDDELTHLEHVFAANGYPPRLVQQCLHNKPKERSELTDTTEDTTKPTILLTPYVKGFSEKLERRSALIFNVPLSQREHYGVN